MSKMFKIEVQKKYFIFRLNSTTRSKDTAKVVIATASVKKFEEAVLAAGLTPQKYQEVDILFCINNQIFFLNADINYN
jgi:hypothetical protein